MGNYVWMSPRLGNKWKFNPNIQGFPQTVGGSSSFPSNIGCFYTDFWPISSTAVLDLLIHRRLPTQFGRGAKSCLIPSSWGKSYSTENLLNVLKKKKKKEATIEEQDASKQSFEILTGKFRTLQMLCGTSPEGTLRARLTNDEKISSL